MTWGRPWPGPELRDAPHAPRRLRSAHVAIACAGLHALAVGGWLLARELPLTSSWSRPPSLLPSVVVVTRPAPTPPPEPEPEARPGNARFWRLALNRSRPNVVVAWSATELAYSSDEAEGIVHTSPLPLAAGTTHPPQVVVTPSGAALVARARQDWLRTSDGKHFTHEPAPFPDEVFLIAADARRIVADVRSEDGIERFMVSTDDGRTWTEGPQPPRESYAIAIRPSGKVVLSYAWSVSCGGGDEGFATWSPGDAAFEVDSRAPISFLGADRWLYGQESWLYGAPSGGGEDEQTLRAWGPGGQVALGPTVPKGTEPWFATDGRVTYAGVGPQVLSLRNGQFAPFDEDAPADLQDVAIDGRGRLVGLTYEGISRRNAEGDFVRLRLFDAADLVSERPPEPAPPR